MLRNDEDYLRHIITLSRELKNAKDIPQVVISFEEQTMDALCFSVVLVRVLNSSLPLEVLLSSFPFKTQLRQLRHVGWIKKSVSERGLFCEGFPAKIDVFTKGFFRELAKS